MRRVTPAVILAACAGATVGAVAVFVIDPGRRGGGRGAISDAALADRVESVLFRDPAIPNGAVSVNVEHGVVVLRGVVRDEHQQWSLERRAWRIPGVWSVENRLRVGRPSRVQDRQLATARAG